MKREGKVGKRSSETGRQQRRAHGEIHIEEEGPYLKSCHRKGQREAELEHEQEATGVCARLHMWWHGRDHMLRLSRLLFAPSWSRQASARWDFWVRSSHHLIWNRNSSSLLLTLVLTASSLCLSFSFTALSTTCKPDYLAAHLVLDHTQDRLHSLNCRF